MTLQQARALAEAMESPKRFAHTLNVEKMAVALAAQHGADTVQAALAALLHDAAKELPKGEMLRILQNDVIMAGNTQKSPAPVWHGVCAAILAKQKWNVTDEAVLSAIACHTTGKPNMSKLDKIIYLADMLCEERDFAGVAPLRTLAYQDLDVAMGACLAHTMHHLQQSGKSIDSLSLAAYQDYVQR